MTVRRPTTRARSAIFAPLGDEGRASRVENRIAEAIRSGVLADGERLPSEPELAGMLGVATVTAREALVGLRAQGLVTTTRGRGGGSFVTSSSSAREELGGRLAAMSRLELRDRGAVYSVVLAGCAELAAERVDDEDVLDLRDLLVRDESDVGAWRHSDSELFLSVAALTQSARLVREVVRLEADFGGLLRLPLVDEEFRRGATVRNHALVEAVARRRPDEARARMREHVHVSLEALTELHATLR